MAAEDVSRRGFLAAGTGLFVFFRAPRLSAESAQDLAPPVPYPLNYSPDFNAYLRIGADGRVTCYSSKVELGQGAMTSLAQCLAEELDVAVESVDMVMADTDLCQPDFGTVASMTSPLFSPVVRKAGAEARAVLLEMAAERLQAPLARLVVHAGNVTDPAQDRQISYGELVQGKRIERHVANVPTKAPAAFEVIGKAPQRKDALDKITGKAQFAGDIALPGMLCARVLRPPAHGARLKSVDTDGAGKMGARVLREGDLVAVLHERRDLADQALSLVNAQFEPAPPGTDDQSIFDHLVKFPGRVVAEKGSISEGARLASALVDGTYYNSYVAHAPIEPHAAVAKVEGGVATVWASAASPFRTRQAVAQELGFPEDRVRIITSYVGGAFGGKSFSLQAVEAARLAKSTGRPVQVVWDRSEEFFYTQFRPAAVVKIRSGLSGEGKIVLWEFQVWGAGDRDTMPFYDIPHQRAVSSGTWRENDGSGMHSFGVGPWRGPSANTNTFARESHMDVLAARVGADPVEFRMSHLSQPRMRRVLEAATEQFGWQPIQMPSGRGVGVACGMYWDTWLASMAQVSVDRNNGAVRVERVVLAMDQGLTLNFDGTQTQMESGIIMGLGALTEEVHFRNGEILDRNFDTYQIPRFSWIPKIETVVIENSSLPARGNGEPVIITLGAVLANAIYDAVGARVFQLPMTPERVKAAIEQGRG